MKSNILAIAIITLSTLMMSCSDDNEVTSDYGRLSVKLTDAPFPHDLVAEANVTIFKVDARYKGDINLDDEMIDSTNTTVEIDGDKPFIVLMEDEVQVNLLELTNGVTKNLADINIPIGTYDLIRVYVEGINVVLKDGTTYDLKVPSGSQSGIKIFIKPGLNVSGGLTSDLLLDFDVSRSFVAKGGTQNITGFNFKPVIKASNMSTAGTLAGIVTELQEETLLGVEGAQIAVFVADTLNTTTFTDVDGSYMLLGLDAGSYTVEVEKEGYIMQTADNVQIDAANKTVLDFELTLED
ncbi:Carboxypeptidase regulatory-like domain-containing protein [Maribacter dokdonensis]|uniref:DUF4382 domain-containing protein n=1 Tax=Maribacter dokdonensis TaxID=320912 RepID=UPI001B1707D3|nr:DUF4382 domain-containing protein [Maribacter dokdonensis]CAG2532659.1 Carboxypeptidase regulatory-like domain-containing protein [Maribacter dokdonensis]